MSIRLVFGLAMISAATSFSQEAPADYRFLGNIQMQGDKSWADGWGGDNINDLWGRLNFGAEYKQNDFSSKFNIRVYPEAFGFEPVVGATYDTTNRGAVNVNTSPQSKVQVNHAWVKQQFPDFAIRVGRFETRQTPSFIFGDYIDLAPNPAFGSRQAVHNATEITGQYGALTSSLLLGTNDRHLNRGFVRVYESWKSDQGLTLAAGVRSNLPDLVYDQGAEWQNRLDASVHYSPDTKWGVFAEYGMIQVTNALDQFPLLMGLYFPAAFWADKISLEGEYMPDRVIGGEDRPFMMAVYGQKTVFTRATFDVGVYSDPKGNDFEDMGTIIRFTCLLK